MSLSKNINPSLVLVQPRKTRPYITERLLIGRKESNQINKQEVKLPALSSSARRVRTISIALHLARIKHKSPQTSEATIKDECTTTEPPP